MVRRKISERRKLTRISSLRSRLSVAKSDSKVIKTVRIYVLQGESLLSVAVVIQKIIEAGFSRHFDRLKRSFHVEVSHDSVMSIGFIWTNNFPSDRKNKYKSTIPDCELIERN